jgi:hypothetical protein
MVAHLRLLFAAALGTAPVIAQQERLAHRVFTTSEQCGVCHIGAPGASAMQNADGDDVSPYAMWQGTMMANSFRDPYFRAQLQKESEVMGEAVQELCLRCHAPMASHGAVLAGRAAPRLNDLAGDLFADDGVSCTTCHMITGEGLGEQRTFSGRPVFDRERRIYGPFADVLTQPMRNLVRYTPTHGEHVRDAALCATCHTLYTEHEGVPFAEQTPYLEWRNSDFDVERGGETARTCQQCHMPENPPTRIARSPAGFDFRIPKREGYRVHAFVGGNAFMLDLLREHADDLDVTAEREALAMMADATREQLAERTARLSISAIEHDGATAKFSVSIENLTGHKFPTGYPARRAWLHVRVLLDGEVAFESGAFDAEGRLAGVDDEHRLPHVRTVEKVSDVAVYEMVAADPTGAPTTVLMKMVARQKDNRLLPRGYRADGPHVEDTAPVGTDGDADFAAGGDTVGFRITLPRGGGRLRVEAELLYQSVPPLWVDALRGVEAEEAQRFVRIYDAAAKAPEKVARAERAGD